MTTFSSEEIDEIDRLWRQLPADHIWTGWAASGDLPEVVWLFRTRAHWRRFPLTRSATGYVLSDDRGQVFQQAATLGDLLKAVEAVPALQATGQD